MIDVTIYDAQQMAQKQGVSFAGASGGFQGPDPAQRVRDQFAKNIQKNFDSNDVDATVSRSGSRKLTIEIEDATRAAWTQGIIPWLMAKFIPSSIEHRIANDLRDQLEDNGVRAEVSVQ
jgi:hypothetical protein